jgi:F-type H+-transporting ATPase subunit epsilon
MATTEVEVVSPTKVLFEGGAEMVVTRSVDGEIAFLADHVALLAALDICVTRIVAPGGAETRIAIAGGLVEVRDNKVSILAADAALADDIDLDAARAELQEAEQRQPDPSDPAAVAAAATAIRRAQVRLEAAGSGGSGAGGSAH